MTTCWNIGLPSCPRRRATRTRATSSNSSATPATRTCGPRRDRASASSRRLGAGFGADDSYQTGRLIEWNESRCLAPKCHLSLPIRGGTAFGGSPSLQQSFRLGGPGELSALQRGELRGTDFGLHAPRPRLARHRPRLVARHDALRRRRLRGGRHVDAGRRGDLDETRLGASCSWAATRLFGPVTASFGFRRAPATMQRSSASAARCAAAGADRVSRSCPRACRGSGEPGEQPSASRALDTMTGINPPRAPWLSPDTLKRLWMSAMTGRSAR